MRVFTVAVPNAGYDLAQFLNVNIIAVDIQAILKCRLGQRNAGLDT